MNTSDSFGRSHERAFSIALMRLNALIEAGRDEEADGDAVRDEMDMQWYRMDDRQRERMDYLSVDLEDLAQAKGKPDYVESVDREWAREMQSVREDTSVEGADRILALLRDPRAGRNSGNIAFIQARNYERLGMPEVAFRFFVAAEERDNTFETVILIFLWHQGWMHLALPRVDTLLAGSQRDPIAVFFACAVLLDTVRNTDKIAARSIFERIRNHMIQSVKSIEQASPQTADLADLHPVAVMMLGMCLERLGDTSGAIKVFDRFLAKPNRNPVTDADIFGLRGFTKVDSDHPNAIKDFRIAVGKGTSSPWPYLFLVQNALQNDKPLEVIPLCNHAINFLNDVPDVLKSLFYEGLAIAMARLGQPKQWILENFDRAIDLSPNDTRLRNNRAIAAAGSNREEWKPLTPNRAIDIRQATIANGSVLKFVTRIANQASQTMESAGFRSVA